MAYDAGRGVTVLFGGYSNGTYCGDTWEWNGSAWTLRSSPPAAGPSPRGGHAMAYDAGRGVTLMFGGYYYGGGDHYLGDTWEWNGSAWTLRSTSGPSPRVSHAMAYDAGRGVTVLFGGRGYGGAYYGDTWEYRRRARPVPTPSAIELDMNTDGKLNGLDIQPFVSAILSAPNDPTNVYIGDFDNNGMVDLTDVDPFVTALINSAP